MRKKNYSSLLFMNMHVKILDKILANSVVLNTVSNLCSS